MVKKRKYLQKKKLGWKKQKLGKELILAGAIGIILIILLAVFWPAKKLNGQSQFLASPITHFIASLSAQKKPIIIDPDFSYQEGRLQDLSPQKIIIPSLNIDLAVVEAPIVDGFWQTSTQSASFGLGSAYPGQTGNTVIFAHAQTGLFANLGSIKKDAPIYILAKEKWFSYKVEKVKTVLPTAVEIISATPDKTLTLYTCSGFKDAYRFVVTAKASDSD